MARQPTVGDHENRKARGAINRPRIKKKNFRKGAGAAPRCADRDRCALKVGTYNIHSCLDTSNVFDMEKIARVLEAFAPDTVALQEVDANQTRTGGIHQAEWLARRLKMNYRFYPLVQKGVGQYGLAILSKISMQKIKLAPLPSLWRKKPREVRGAMWVLLQTPLGPVHFINTHLGLNGRERLLQIDALLGEDWLGGLAADDPIIFCGDFNAGRRSLVYRQVCARYMDVQGSVFNKKAPKPTFFSFFPIWCLDYIFISPHFKPLRVAVPSAPAARKASDHLPVFAELVNAPTNAEDSADL